MGLEATVRPTGLSRTRSNPGEPFQAGIRLGFGFLGFRV